MTMEPVYDASSIDVLEGLEPVRLRPSMYIGNVDVSGLHHLVYEVVDNSIDEAMAGYCDRIEVIIHSDNSVSVEDNGRGIPVDIHQGENIPAVELVLTRLHAGGKFDNDAYKVSGGLHGVGVSVVNALSKFLAVEIFSRGSNYRQTFEKGIKTCELKTIGPTDKQGTRIHFFPDTDIFTTDQFSYDILSRRMRELAFLNKGIRIVLEDKRTGQKDAFFYEGGILSFVEYLNRRNTALHPPILVSGTRNEVQIEVAIQYNDSFNEKIFTFANNINTAEGGFHLIGFKAALTRTVNSYAVNGNLPKSLQAKISGDDIREGLTAIVSVRIKNPQFEGQTKTKLGNSEVKGLVESLINERLAIFLEENPGTAKKILAKAVDAARARDAAKRARDLARKQGSLIDSTLLGKLAECQNQRTRTERELFLVEGDSAGGSCQTGARSQVPGHPAVEGQNSERRKSPVRQDICAVRRSKTSSPPWAPGWARRSTTSTTSAITKSSS
jgi:DNA gyrase subunit B